MNDFERKFPDASDVANLRPHRLIALTEFGSLLALLKRQSYGRFDADTVLAGMITFLGLDSTRYLMSIDPTKTVEVAGLVLNDHIDQTGLGQKDLQVNLLLNVIADLTRTAGVGKTQSFSHAENIVRKLDLPSEIKLKLKVKLFDESVLFSNKIWITRKE